MVPSTSSYTNRSPGQIVHREANKLTGDADKYLKVMDLYTESVDRLDIETDKLNNTHYQAKYLELDDRFQKLKQVRRQLIEAINLTNGAPSSGPTSKTSCLSFIESNIHIFLTHTNNRFTAAFLQNFLLAINDEENGEGECVSSNKLIEVAKSLSPDKAADISKILSQTRPGGFFNKECERLRGGIKRQLLEIKEILDSLNPLFDIATSMVELSKKEKLTADEVKQQVNPQLRLILSQTQKKAAEIFQGPLFALSACLSKNPQGYKNNALAFTYQGYARGILYTGPNLEMPDEMWTEIFSKLLPADHWDCKQLSDYHNCFQVSRNWNKMLKAHKAAWVNNNAFTLKKSYGSTKLDETIDRLIELKIGANLLDFSCIEKKHLIKMHEKHPEIPYLLVNSIEDVPNNVCFSRLKKLELGIKGIQLISFLEVCPNLISLNIERCTQVTGEQLINALRACPFLAELKIKKVDMTFEQLLQLARLCSALDLPEIHSTFKEISGDQIIRIVKQNPNLKKLRFASSDITIHQLKEIAQLCPHLISLDLEGLDRIKSGELVEAFRLFPHLENLTFPIENITYDQIDAIRKLWSHDVLPVQLQIACALQSRSKNVKR